MQPHPRHDPTSDWEARRRGKTVRYHDFRSDETVVLEPLPCWEHLLPEEIQERVRHMVGEIEEETADRHRRNGTRILGRRAAQEAHPHDSVQSPKRKRGEAAEFPTSWGVAQYI